MEQVLTGRIALGDLISLARRAAFELNVTDPALADALEGSAAEVELTTHEYAPEHAPC